MTVSLWRIASDTASWTAEDMAGKGAAIHGSRWNQAGEHVTYASTSISLAAWETRAHLAKGMALINPAHPDAAGLTVDRVRQFVYDHRV